MTPGNWSCLLTWLLYEFALMVTRRIIASWFICLGLCMAPRARAADDPGAAAGASEFPAAVVSGVREVLDGSHPNIAAADLLAYYRRSGPDIFEEICRQVADDDRADPAAYIRRLADHFRKMERVRRRNPTEYERLVELEQLESRARLIGRRIQDLAEALELGKVTEGIPAEVALARTKQHLRRVLEQAFDASQQNQRIEINRLEAELRAMRRLLDEREAKKDLILQQRFLQLSGQEMPEAAEPIARGEDTDPR